MLNSSVLEDRDYEPQFVSPTYLRPPTDEFDMIEIKEPTYNIYGQRSGFKIKRMHKSQYDQYMAAQRNQR